MDYVAAFRGGITRRISGAALTMLALAALTVSVPAAAANYPLELVSPRAAGSRPMDGVPSIPAGHRIFKAYPGLTYNIRAVVIGGAYPYTFSLEGAPSGMTIDARTGEIDWPNPSGGPASPTINVTDSEGAQRSSTWTITVTTNGFRFVDAVNGSTGGTGTIDNPWRDLLQVHQARAPGEILYLRDGTYSNSGISRNGSNGWERIEFFGESHPMTWLAYPGEAPVYNAGYSSGNTGALLRFQPVDATPVYLDGLEVFNFRNIGVQVISGTSDYSVFRRMTFHDMIQGIEGGNPAGIMFTSSYPDPTYYGAVQDSEFFDLNNGGGLKFYSHKKVLVEDNLFRDSADGFDLKTHVPRFEVRGNTFRNIQSRALYGNMHFGGGGNGESASGEWRFNNILAPNASVAVDVNQDGEASVVYVYRNTIRGRAQVREVSSDDGPFHFYNNVIVNSDSGTPPGSRITFTGVSDQSRVVIRDNLVGSPNAGIIDTNGNLTGDYAQYVGSRGHQIGTVGAWPSPPTDFRVE